ncbi:MAG: sigma 54-interacting transcriptional regulator, partial [Planctomycetota bacterium]
MAHLLLLGGPHTLSRLQIEKAELILGRAGSADLRISDRKASAAHCRIERTTSGYRICDLESQNGTWVNGKRVRRRKLKPGDVICVGSTELRFEDEEAERPRGKRKARVEKQLAELEEALGRFLRVAGQEDRDEAAQRLKKRAARFAEGVQDPEVLRLRKLVSWIRRLTNERDHEHLLSLMLDSVVDLSGAERGFLMLLEGSKEPRIRIARNFDMEALRKPTFKVARGVAAAVARHGQPILSMNADEDPQIKSFGDTGALNLRSVACVPIRAGERLLGALYLDNRFERGVLQPEDLPFLLSFADQAAIAVENARLNEETRRARKEVEDLNRILKGRIEKQEQELHEVTALYAQAAAEARTKYSYDAIVGKSPLMRELFFLLDRVTDSDVPVFLMGESGTGKELAARAIHFNGPRKDGPFVAENCAAIPATLFESELFGYLKGAFTGAAGDKKGLFQLADKGTLFLDEIAEMPLALQAKLLRALQEHEIRPVGGSKAVAVDVRIVTASNRNLPECVRKGTFREDLFHRIHVIEVPIPALRRRKGDLPLLVDFLLDKIGRERGDGDPKPMSKSARELIQRYDWPGNVRELENEILRAVTLSGDEILPEDLSPALRGGAGPLASRYSGATL